MTSIKTETEKYLNKNKRTFGNMYYKKLPIQQAIKGL